MVEVKTEDIKEAQERDAEEKSPKKFKRDDSQLHEKIRKQIEYYFSNVNVVKDKFMKEEFSKNGGWVKISVLLTFARLKEITKDEDEIVRALQDYKSDVINFDQESKQIARLKPLPDAEKFQKQLDARTVHISGFPIDSTFEQLRQFCGSFGEVESLSMRKLYKTKHFKGCIHVVYKTEEEAKKVLTTEALKFKDRELRKESMEEYYKRKAEMKEKREAKKKEPKSTKENKTKGDTKTK